MQQVIIKLQTNVANDSNGAANNIDGANSNNNINNNNGTLPHVLHQQSVNGLT